MSDDRDDRFGDEIEWTPAQFSKHPLYPVPDPPAWSQVGHRHTQADQPQPTLRSLGGLGHRIRQKMDGLRAEIDRQIAYAEEQVEYARKRTKDMAKIADEQRKLKLEAESVSRRWEATARQIARDLVLIKDEVDKLSYIERPGIVKQLRGTEGLDEALAAIQQLRRLLPEEDDDAGK